MRRDLALGGTVGALAGLAAALLYHFTGTPTGTFGFAAAEGQRFHLPHPGWWPSIVVIPIAFVAGSLVVSAAFAAMTRRSP